MIPSDFFVELADFNTDRAAIAAIREPVFEIEQQVPNEIVWDALDPLCRHVIARALDGTPIGSGRLTPQHGIGRLAVLKPWRGKGVGASLLTNLIDTARSLHYPEVELHSQVHAIPFYQRFGFVAEGETYMEAGIPHQTMRLSLAAQAPLEREAPPSQAESAEIEFDGLEQARALTLQLLKASRRQLWIFTRDLDPELFKGEDFAEALRQIAIAGRGAEIRILVQDITAAQLNGGNLLALAQRMSSVVHIQQPDNETDLQFAGAYLLNDQSGLLTRPNAARHEGACRLHAPGHHRQLLDQFRQVWERSHPVSELRAQSL